MASQGKSVQHRAPGAHLAVSSTIGSNVYAIILPAHIGYCPAIAAILLPGSFHPRIPPGFFRLQNAIIVIDFAQFPMLKTVVKMS